ncbi:MAG: hypothetical protein ACE5OS_06450 [Anaerolineae bacterium]
MKSFVNNKTTGVLLSAFVIVSTAALSAGASTLGPESLTGAESIRGPELILLYDEDQVPHRVPPPAQIRSGVYVQTANFTVKWNPSGCTGTLSPWPQAAKDAFQYAVSIWASTLNSSQTIVIDACWRSDLGSGVLGSARARSPHHDFPNAPYANTWYQVALANTLSNSDLNDSDLYDWDGDGNDADSEILANFSSTFDWYYGTDGNTPGTQVDFASVVLHELGHGLGFAGSMNYDDGAGYPECNGTAGVGCWGYGTAYPYIYDRFTEDNSGTSLIAFTNHSTALGSALVSTNVFFDGTHANAANGGSRVELYAPNPWKPSSSYSHLDESFSGTENALMTYSLGPGSSEHNPGPVMLGMFKDMGWTIGDADLRILKRVLGEGLNLAPGDPVTFTLSIENIGGATATGVVVTDTLSTDILTPTFETSLAGITATGVISYVWELPDLAASASGAITVYGTISHTMPITGFAIWNTASISSDGIEEDTNNNSSTVLVGGHRIYLPLILLNL